MNDENSNDELHSSMSGPGGLPSGDDESVSLESGRPAVASAPGKILVFLIAGAIFLAIVVRALFFSSAGPTENKPQKHAEKVAPSNSIKTSGITPGELPTPPQPDPDLGYNSRTSSAYSGTDTGVPDLSAKLPPPPTGTSATLPNLQAPPVLGAGASPSFVAPATLTPNAMPTLAAPPVRANGGTVASFGATTGTGGLQPPPPPPSMTPPTLPDVQKTAPRDEAALKRNAAEMFVNKGPIASGTGTGAKPKVSASFSGNDANSQFANGAITASHQESATAERIEHLDYTLIQGKIIDCVLETAIDSDLPGTIRAIVSHDVYAEAGRRILVPKGSRMLGTYNAGVKKGQGRVFIVWTRLIRPDGITINVDSPGIDGLGRAGVAGDVDNKYFEMFSSALLTSSMDIGIAALGQALFGDDQSTTTTNGSGGTTTTSSPTADAVRAAVDSIGAVGKTIVNNTVALTPTITIDQGTPVNVFVNRELVFPPSVIDNSLYIE